MPNLGTPTASVPPGEYDRKVVLVLGASRGIGAATARSFARQGARVVLASRNEEALRAIAREVREEGAETWVARTDLANAESVVELGRTLRENVGRLDAAFNNAGEGFAPTPLVDVPDEAFARVLGVTVVGTFLALKQEIPLLRAAGGGAIVNMSSTAGITAFTGGAPYVTAKHAILGLTKAAAIDYASEGIRVNAVAPGPIDTERMQSLPEDYRARARSAVPMRRLGRAEDVANVVLWLCSERAQFVTGATVIVDGGRLAGFA